FNYEEPSSVVNKVDNKFTWIIKNFSTLESDKIYSNPFVTGGCKWHLLAYPKGNKIDYLSLFLEVADHGSLPCGWRRHVLFRLSIVNQKSKKLSQLQVAKHWFDQKSPNFGFTTMIPLAELHANGGGFLVNGQVKIVAEIDVLEIKDEDEPQPMKKIKLEDDTQQLKESNEAVINGLEILQSQIEFVRSLFQKHPDVALEFRSKNSHLRTGYMNVLLSLTKKLCKSPRELSNDDISDVGAALVYMTEAGFKLDWLEKKLDEVKEKKKTEEACLAQLQEMEEELKPLKQKFVELKARMDKKKAELLEARTPLSLDL
ncbi:unnamed protein product, partial [Thlaspi arvense]